MKINGNKPRNYAIDLFRFFCAVSVIAIHTVAFKDINGDLGYWTKHVFSRIAVPFFCCVAGYYFTKKLKNNKHPLKHTVLKLLRYYIFWSIIYIVFNTISKKISNENLHINSLYIVKTIWGSFTNFFTLGTNQYHLWFFPFIIYSILIINYFYKKGHIRKLFYISLLLYIITVIGSAYPRIASNIPIIRSIMTWNLYDQVVRHFFGNTLAFACLGAYMAGKNSARTNKNKDFIIEIVMIIMFITENLYIYKFQGPKYQSITLSLYPLLYQTFKILLNTKPSSSIFIKNISNYSKSLADYIYFSHVLWRDLVILVLVNVLNTSGKDYTLQFFLTFSATILTGTILYQFRNNKYIQKYVL